MGIFLIINTEHKTMGPKPDPDEIKYLYMKVVGGEVTSAAALAPKCGPIGLPPKKVGEGIQKATSKWRGVKIEIEIAVQNRQCTVKEILGTAVSLGCTVDGKSPKDIQSGIDAEEI